MKRSKVVLFVLGGGDTKVYDLYDIFALLYDGYIIYTETQVESRKRSGERT